MERVFSEQLEAGTFTHIYCSCGFLEEPRVIYTFTHLPDDLDIFDLASLTKPLVVLPLITRKFLLGKLDFSDSLGTWLSSADHSFCAEITELSIENLLCHRSGLPAWCNFWINSLSGKTLTLLEKTEILNRCVLGGRKEIPLYSDINFILLGICLEIVKGKKLDVLFNEFISDYLHFFPSGYLGFLPDKKEQAVPTAYCQIRNRLLQGEVHDENCAVFGGVSGHAGLFASGDDLITYLRKLFTSEVGLEILRRNNEMLSANKCELLFGLQRGDGESSEVFGGGQALGHLGFTGTAFWLDPSTGGYAVLLTNRTIKSRVVSGFHMFRRQVFAGLSDLLGEANRTS